MTLYSWDTMSKRGPWAGRRDRLKPVPRISYTEDAKVFAKVKVDGHAEKVRAALAGL